MQVFHLNQKTAARWHLSGASLERLTARRE